MFCDQICEILSALNNGKASYYAIRTITDVLQCF